MAEILGIATFVMVIAGFFVGNMMISLENAFFVQLSYFSLLYIGQLNPLFYALTGLKYSNGYNIPITHDNPLYESNFIKHVVGIGMYSAINDNVNISLCLILFFILIGGVIKLIATFIIQKEELK